MSDFDVSSLDYGLNSIQPISDDFFSDGHLVEFARIDHQHPLSVTLQRKLPTFGSGNPPASLISGGKWYWDFTNSRLWRSDSSNWIIMGEITDGAFVPVVTPAAGAITLVGAHTFNYHRSDGWIDWTASIAITTNGTGAGNITITLPVASHANSRAIGAGREDNLTGKMLNVVSNGATASIFYYDNTYPGANGCLLNVGGRYQMISPYS